MNRTRGRVTCGKGPLPRRLPDVGGEGNRFWPTVTRSVNSVLDWIPWQQYLEGHFV
jgi:hypothetical protein